MIDAYLALTAALLFDRLAFLANLEILLGSDGRCSSRLFIGPERVDIVRWHDFRKFAS